MRLLVALAISLFVAGSALAQASPPPHPQKATAAEIAEARRQGDAILSAAHADDIFDNETGLYGTAAILLRHKASGFVCLFNVGEPINNVLVYPNPHRGDDVGCNTRDNATGSRTTNFTRDESTDEQMIAGAGAAIQRRFPDVQPAPPPTQLSPFATMFPNTPTPKSARFLRSGAFEEVVSAHVDGWLVEDRFTAPPSLAQSNTLDNHWYVTITERQRHNQAPQGELSASGSSAPKIAATPSSSDETAIARKEGERMLLANQNQALFDNITDSNVIALRHKASGLVCRFDLGGPNAVISGPGPATSDRTDAVSCMSGMQAFGDVLTVLPNKDHWTTDQAIADGVRVMRSFFSDLRPFTGKSVTLTGDASLPGHKTEEFDGGPASNPVHYYISAAVVGDWVVIEQVHGPTSPPMVGDMYGEVTMVAAILDLAKAKPHSGG